MKTRLSQAIVSILLSLMAAASAAAPVMAAVPGQETQTTGERGFSDRHALGRLEPLASARPSPWLTPHSVRLTLKPDLYGAWPTTASFPAHVQTNGTHYRADATGAVGPEHIAAMTWDGMHVHRRDGTLVSEATLDEFWAPLGPFKGVSPGVCNTNLYTLGNPMLRYDPLGGRWIATATASNGSDEGSLLLGVSKTSSPVGDWHFHRIYADAARKHVIEFPNFGFNACWIVVQAGVTLGYELGSQTGAGSRIWVFDKARLYAGETNAAFTVINRPDLNYSQWVVPNYDTNGDVMNLVGLGNDLGNESRNSLRLYTISGQIGYEVFGLGATVSSTQPWRNIPSGGFNANTLPQKGTNAMLAPQDSVPLSAMQRNGSIWVAHHIQLPTGTTRRTSVQWWQIDPRGTVHQRGLIDDPGNQTHYAFPSIGVNKYGDAVVGFSIFTTNQYPGANAAWRLANDPPGTLQAEIIHKDGEAPFAWPNPCVANRTEWGWYSSSVFDPVDESLWTLQQYAALPENGRSRWGTRWGRLGPFHGLAVDFRAPATVTRTPDGTRIQGQWPGPWTGLGIPLRVTIANRNAHMVTNVSIALEGLTPGGAYCTAHLDAAYRGLDRLEDLGSDSRYGSRCRIDSIAPGEVVVVQWYACDNFLGSGGTFTNVLTVGVGPNQNADGSTTVSAITQMVPDSDGDDLPDDWETANGLSPSTAADANHDSDSDGLSNRQEYLAGTRPGDASSRVELLSVTRVTAGTSPGWRLLMRTVNGRFYRIERTERLSDPQWLTVADEIRGTGTNLGVTDPDITSPGPRFYRALALP